MALGARSLRPRLALAPHGVVLSGVVLHCVVIIGVVLLGGAPPLAAADGLTIVAERTLLPDGTLAEGLAVVIDDEGRIARVIAVAGKELPEPVRRFGAGSVLAPGLHELLSALGAPGEREESVRTFDAAADAAQAIDPLRRDLDRARRAGILVATVAPAPRNPVSGIAATFLTGARPELARIGGAAAPLLIAVGESALDPLREPTSRSGLRRALEEWLAGPGARALEGRAAPLVHCGEAMDVRAAIELFPRGAVPTLVLSTGIRECAEILARASPERRPAIVVVGPYGPGSAPAELAGAAHLARAGVEIALSGAFPAAGDDALRDAARRAVGHGLDPAAARRAITANPARAVGLAAEIGSIAPKRRADLVIFSGDPLLAGSAVVALWQGGVEIPVPAALPDPAGRGARPEIPEIPVIPEIPESPVPPASTEMPEKTEQTVGPDAAGSPPRPAMMRAGPR